MIDKSMITIFEEIIDRVMLLGKTKGTSKEIKTVLSSWPSSWLHGLSRKEEEKIKEKAENYKKEIELSFSDPYYREAYEIYSKDILSDLLAFFNQILSSKRERKSRTRKVSVVKATKQFKFNSNGDVNLKSLPFITSPDKIIGSSALLVWIPNQRIAVWIEAKDRNGLAINKNNVVRFDETKSFAKRVRKPEEFASVVQSSNKSGVRNYLKSIKTQEYEIDGKMNKKYVLVRVW